MPKQTKRIRVSREACSNEAADSAKLVRMGYSKEAAQTALASNSGCGFDAALAFLARQAAREEAFKKNRAAREPNLCSLHTVGSLPLRSKDNLANTSKAAAAATSSRSRLGKENTSHNSCNSKRASDNSRRKTTGPPLIEILQSTQSCNDSRERKGAVPRGRRDSVASTSKANFKSSAMSTVVDRTSEVCEICRMSTAVDSDSDESTGACTAEAVLLCECCDAEAHLSCLGLRRVPKKDWFCSACANNNSGVNSTSAPAHQSGHLAPNVPTRRNNPSSDNSSSTTTISESSGKVPPGKSYAAAAASPPGAAKHEARNQRRRRRRQGGAEESAQLMPPPPPPLPLRPHPDARGGGGTAEGGGKGRGRREENPLGVARHHGRPTRAQLMRPVATPAPKPPPVEAPEDGLLTEDRDCSDSETKATLPRTRVAVENLVGVFAIVARQKPTPQKQAKRTRRGL